MILEFLLWKTGNSYLHIVSLVYPTAVFFIKLFRTLVNIKIEILGRNQKRIFLEQNLKDWSSHQTCSVRKGVLRNFAKFTGKHLCQSLFFNKVADLGSATLLKERLWHRCFPVNFAKFLGTLSRKTSGRLLLQIFIVTNWIKWSDIEWEMLVDHCVKSVQIRTRKNSLFGNFSRSGCSSKFKILCINPLTANPTKWSNTLKQFVGNLPTNCLSVFDYFVKLVLKGLRFFIYIGKPCGLQNKFNEEIRTQSVVKLQYFYYSIS